jgi:hypothetical protein
MPDHTWTRLGRRHTRRLPDELSAAGKPIGRRAIGNEPAFVDLLLAVALVVALIAAVAIAVLWPELRD